MAHVTGNTGVQDRAAEILAAVLRQPRGMVSPPGKLEAEAHYIEPDEEWEVLAAVVTSLQERWRHGDARQPATEIRLLRHLASRRPNHALADG